GQARLDGDVRVVRADPGVVAVARLPVRDADEQRIEAKAGHDVQRVLEEARVDLRERRRAADESVPAIAVDLSGRGLAESARVAFARRARGGAGARDVHARAFE